MYVGPPGGPDGRRHAPRVHVRPEQGPPVGGHLAERLSRPRNAVTETLIDFYWYDAEGLIRCEKDFKALEGCLYYERPGVSTGESVAPMALEHLAALRHEEADEKH